MFPIEEEGLLGSMQMRKGGRAGMHPGLTLGREPGNNVACGREHCHWHPEPFGEGRNEHDVFSGGVVPPQ